MKKTNTEKKIRGDDGHLSKEKDTEKNKMK